MVLREHSTGNKRDLTLTHCLILRPVHMPAGRSWSLERSFPPTLDQYPTWLSCLFGFLLPLFVFRDTDIAKGREGLASAAGVWDRESGEQLVVKQKLKRAEAAGPREERAAGWQGQEVMSRSEEQVNLLRSSPIKRQRRPPSEGPKDGGGTTAPFSPEQRFQLRQPS